MARLNQVTLIGYLTADPELKQTPSGTSVCPFTIAVNRKTTKEGAPSCDFINVVAWRERAEFVSRYFKKGKPILIHGELQVRSYTDKQGAKCYVTEVFVNEADFVENKGVSDNAKPAEDGSADSYNPYVAAATAAEFEEVSHDQLPF